MHEPPLKRLRLFTKAQVEKDKLHDILKEKLKEMPVPVKEVTPISIDPIAPHDGLVDRHAVLAGMVAGFVVHHADCDGKYSYSLRPPVRGRPVSGRLRHGEVYIGRTAKYGDPKWGNWHRVFRHFTAERCVQLHRQEFVDR